MVIKNVQALRGIAALLVVLFHMGDVQGLERRYISPELDLTQVFGWFGWAGVDLFFVISGFIMVVTTWNQFAKPRAGIRFFLRRLVRVYPAYWLVLVPVFVVYVIRPDFVNAHGTRPDVLASFLLLPQAGDPLLLVSWSLVFEMEFYLVFAIALLLPRRFLPYVVGAWVLAIVVAANLVSFTANPYGTLLGSWLSLEFIFGMIVGALTMSNALRRPVTALAAGTLVLGAAFVAMASPLHVEFPVWAQIAGIALPFAVLLYGAVGVERLRSWQAPSALVLLGDASYAIYLWHVPVLSAFGRCVELLHLHGAAAHAVVDLLFVAAVMLVGIAVYRYLERPLTRALNRRIGSVDGATPPLAVSRLEAAPDAPAPERPAASVPHA